MRVSKLRSVVCDAQAILTIALSEATHTRLASHRRWHGGVVSSRTRSVTLLPCTARVTVERRAGGCEVSEGAATDRCHRFVSAGDLAGCFVGASFEDEIEIAAKSGEPRIGGNGEVKREE